MVRIALYRDMDMPTKLNTIVSRWEEPNCTNIRYPGWSGAMFSIQKGQHVRPHS